MVAGFSKGLDTKTAIGDLHPKMPAVENIINTNPEKKVKIGVEGLAKNVKAANKNAEIKPEDAPEFKNKRLNNIKNRAQMFEKKDGYKTEYKNEKQNTNVLG